MEQLAIYITHVILYASLAILIVSLNSQFRLIYFYIYIVFVLIVGGFFGAVYSFPITPTITISGGSLAYGALMMSTMIMVIRERDMNLVRTVIKLIVAANIFKFFLFSIISWALSSSAIINPFNTSASVFGISVKFMVIGGILIIFELLLLIFLFERINPRLNNNILISSIYLLFFISILCLDGVLFPILAFSINPDLIAIIVGGVKSKFVLSISYGFFLLFFMLINKDFLTRYITSPIRLQELFAAPKDVLTEELKRQHAALETSEERIIFQATLINSVGEAVIATDLDGKITYTNFAAEEMYGWKKEEVIGKDVTEIKSPEDANLSAANILEDIKKGKSWKGEFLVKRKDGKNFPAHVTDSPLLDRSGKLVGIISVSRDITEPKRAEQALNQSNEQLRLLSAYLQNAIETERTVIARELHDDFGQSMTALKMDLTWLVNRLPENDEKVERINKMTELVDDSISLMRWIASSLRPGMLDDLGLVATIQWQANGFSERTGILCDLDLPKEDLDFDLDLSTTLFRIFQECLTNISRHAHASQVNCSLKLLEQTLILTVQDDGVGINGSESYDRSSLGLLGMRERAAQWGGDLSIQGIPGKGTTLTVRIPLP